MKLLIKDNDHPNSMILISIIHFACSIKSNSTNQWSRFLYRKSLILIRQNNLLHYLPFKNLCK